MKIKRFWQKRAAAAAYFLIILLLSLTLFAQEQQEPQLKFKSFVTPPGFDASRAAAVAKALDFQNWPHTEARYVAPAVTRSLLTKPELVTRFSTSYSLVEFAQTPYGKCRLSWARLIKNNQPLPRELPAGRKEALLAALPREKQQDPEFVRKYLERKLARYQKSKQFILDGELNIEVCLTPGSRAAREYLLAAMTESSMPTRSLAAIYSAVKRETALGTMNLMIENRDKARADLHFIRGNVYIALRASGCFADEVLPLARKIDARIVKQSSLTLNQLLDRKPVVNIAAQLKDRPAVPYEISLPPGLRTVDMRAFVAGRRAAVRGKTIVLGDQKGKQKVRFIVLTGELLAGVIEKEIDIITVKIP